VYTKCDLVTEESLPRDGPRTSAVLGTGLRELRQRIVEKARAATRPAALAGSLNRCGHHIDAALDHLRQAEVIVNRREPAELLALEVRLVLEQLGEMVGAVYTDDLLDRIFSQFCIGK
jgi:tRNA modification GTPase